MPSIIDSDHYFAWNSTLQHRAEYDTRGYLTKLATQKDSLMFSFQSGTGNLLSRTGMTSQTETFAYDAVDRLTQVSGSTTHSVSYLDNGNIYQKTGPGIYSYLSSHPHAVANVTNPLSIISSDTQTATYTPFGKVSTLSDNGYTLTFTYGPDEQRWKTVLQSSGNTVRTTLYADGYERITENGQTRHFYYLDGGVIYILNDGANNGTFYYTFTDHLGSITRIYNKNRVKVFSAEYDAWGKQTVTLDTLSTLGFHRGYTGHEMLPEFGLINMNGRLYDPILGRFLSPDNYVQMPDFSQSFNRYSYCLNNPLKYTDPSGEIAWFVVAAIAGGAFNVAANMDNINDGGDFFKYFGVGAAAGLAGGYVGNLVAGAIAASGVIGTSGICGGLLIGGASGATSGFILGGGNSWLINGNFSSFLSDAFIGFAIGGVTGALIGGAVGGISAYKQGNNIWTGEKIEPPYCRPSMKEPDVISTRSKTDMMAEPANSDELINTDIELNKSLVPYYPPNDGALNGWGQETLKPGTIIDRYGSPYGRYFSPYKTPIDMRALPPSNNMQYNAYIVVKSIDVQKSIVAPAFGKLGYGIQYKTPIDVNSLIEFKFIIPIK